MIVEHLPSTSPAENAAREEALFRARPFGHAPRLLFYTNTECVQCGRNQLPAAECDLEWCAAQRIPVLKRFSGGGTVWHDPGNLNYAFLLPRELYSPEKVLSLVVETLRDLGVSDARFCSRFSVWHGLWKISGSAFALSGPAALLHGCLPFTCDLERLRKALAAPTAPDAPKSAVASVHSPVANIAPLCHDPAHAREDFQKILSAKAAAAFCG